MNDTTAEQERAAIIAIMRGAISQGYPPPTGNGKRSVCAHDKFEWEDCIACYDDHLTAKLDAIERGDHHKIIDALQNNA